MGDGRRACVERGGEGRRGRSRRVVVVVVMLLVPPLPVLAAPWAPRAVAALLVAAVPPLSGKRRGRGFVLQVRLLQDWRRAQLRGFTERLGGFVVPGGGDLPDLAAAAQA